LSEAAYYDRDPHAAGARATPQLWIPTNLQHLGFTTVNSDYIVRNAALIGLPLAVVAKIFYTERSVVLRARPDGTARPGS
jgi:hypothetical protein